MTKNILIGLAGVVIVILVVFLFRNPPQSNLPDPRVPILQDSIKTEKAGKLILQARIDSLLRKHTQDSSAAIVQQRKSSARIQAKINEVAELELKLAAVIDSIPGLSTLIDGKNNIIAQQGAQIDTLYQELRVSWQTQEELRQAQHTKDRMTARIEAEYSQLTTILEADNQKLRKNLKRQKAVAIIGAVGAFVLGVMVN